MQKGLVITHVIPVYDVDCRVLGRSTLLESLDHQVRILLDNMLSASQGSFTEAM